MEFDASGSTDDFGIANYTWTFTYDGAVRTLYGISPTFVFELPGECVVTLTVTDHSGLSDTDTVVITVVEEETSVAAMAALVGIGAGAAALLLFAVMRSRRQRTS